MKQTLLLIIFIALKNSFLFSQEVHLKFIASKKTENKNIELNKLNRIKSSKDLNKLIDSVNSSLKLKGYFYNKTDSISQNTSHKLIYISFGKKTDSITLTLHKNQNLSAFKEKIAIENLPQFLKTINLKLEATGNPFSKVQLTNITLIEDKINATLQIKNSKKRTLDKIIIKGYNKFPKSYLKHFLKIKPHQVLNKKLISSIENNLNTLSFAKQHKRPEILFSKDSTLVYLYLKKKKQSNFDGLINFSSENPDELNFTGNINLELNNILNTGEQFHLNWNANGNERQNLILETFIPYIFNTAISNKTSFQIYKQDSTFLNSKFTTNFLYNINTKLTAGVSYENEESNNTSNNLNLNTPDFSSQFIGLSFSFNSLARNYFSSPKVSFTISNLIGKRTSSSISNQQFKTNITSALDIEINSKNSINVRNKTGILLSSNYLFNELYRIGGINSIRGFNPQSIFVKKYSFLNIEYRFITSENSYLHSITDPGVVQNINNETQTLLGLGIGYLFKRKNSIINLSLSSGISKLYKNPSLNLSIILKNYF